MAFDKAHLTPLGYGDGQTYWYYKTADTPLVVDSAGYFTGEAVGMLKVGDVILLVQVDDPAAPGAVTAAGHHVVNQNDGTTVDVTNATALTVADLD